VALDQRRFVVMGCDAHLLAHGVDVGAALDAATIRAFHLERVWTRFSLGSEISALNRSGGQPVAVSADTLGLVAGAVDGYWRTGGRFDPTILGDLVRAGYDRDLHAIDTPGSVPMPGSDADGRCGTGCAGIVVDHNSVTLPRGISFDPGGIAKGLAADWLCADLLAAGADGACVNLGGDLRVGGIAPDGDIWRVGVESPSSGAPPIATIELHDGGVATSTTARRRWHTGHHLIDPRTGQSTATDVVAVTVQAATAVEAEILATAAVVAGIARGRGLVLRNAATALFVDPTGRLVA
jgi:thiamine biosynthesis lipoprotein